MSWLHGHGETGRCPTPGLSATGGSTSPSARDCRARSVCRGLSSWTTGPVGPSRPGCPYHPLLLARPTLDAADPMCHVYVEEGDVLWTSGPSWLDLGNSRPGEAAMLQQYWAPSSRAISARQALLLGFSWHRGPEKRCTRSDAGAEVPLLMRCICSGKVLLLSPLALQASHRGVWGNIGRGRDWVVVGCTRVLERWVRGCGPVGLWAGRGFSVCYACNAPRVGLTCAQGAPRVGLTCAQGGQRVGLLHRPCQSAAGLYGACMGACTGPVCGLHGAVLRRLQHPAASCSCQSGGATESWLSRLVRSVSAQ